MITASLVTETKLPTYLNFFHIKNALFCKMQKPSLPLEKHSGKDKRDECLAKLIKKLCVWDT